MTTLTPEEIRRKFAQLDSDVYAIYGLLETISNTQKKHGERLDGIHSRLSRMAGPQMRHGNAGRGGLQAHRDRGHADAARQPARRHGNRLDGVDAKLDTVIEMIGGRSS